MRLILLFLTFFSLGLALAQSPEDDEVTFKTAIDWLNTKLDYIYYDDQNDKWWNNTFYINDDKEITIKQISSKVPITANIKEKSYTIRKFRIQDINPYTIQIKEVREATGRFAQGELLEIHTFDGENKIHKTINNRKATSTSFLHLSFPKTLTDSLSNYPELVKSKLYDAVVAATKVYPVDEVGNRTVIMETFKGEYQSENGSTWKAERLFPNVLKIQSTGREEFFGYDSDSHKYFHTVISEKGSSTRYYQLRSGIHLILENIDDPDDTIFFHTFNSFRKQSEWYYRQ